MPVESIEKFEKNIMRLILLNGWTNIHQHDPHSIWSVPLDQLVMWFDVSEEYQKKKGSV